MFFTVPTILTWTRIVAIPLIMGVFYLRWPPEPVQNLVATVMFIVFAFTDWLDGYLARRLKQTSAFGAFLDPVADKFLVCASLLVLVHLDRADVFVALIIIGREIAISALREWMAEIGQRGKVKVSPLAKLKTIVQIVGLSCMLFRWSLPILPGFSLPVFEIGLVLTVAAAVLTLLSAISYLRAAWPDLRGSA